MEDEEVTTMRDTYRLLAEHRYASWLKAYVPDSPIAFYDKVQIDDYSTVTIGEWGGYLVQIMPMIFNDRLVLTPQHFPCLYDHGWCYDKGPAPLLAALSWNPETQGEPLGYKKRTTAGVRQPGDRATETPRAAERVAELFVVLDAATSRNAQPS